MTASSAGWTYTSLTNFAAVRLTDVPLVASEMMYIKYRGYVLLVDWPQKGERFGHRNESIAQALKAR